MSDQFYIAVIFFLVLGGVLQEWRIRNARARQNIHPGSSRSDISPEPLDGRTRAGKAHARSSFQIDQDLDIFSALPEALLVIGLNGKIERANKTSKEILGIEKLEDKRLSEVLELPENAAMAVSDEERSMHESKPGTLADLEFSSGGRMFSLSVFRIRGRDVRGSFDPHATRLVLIKDISTEHQIGKTRRDFISNASHELKTPVSRMMLVMASLRTSLAKGDGKAAQYIDNLDSDIVNLRRIVADMLDLSRVESSNDDQEAEQIDLGQLTGEAVAELQSAADQVNVHLNFENKLAPAFSPAVVTGRRDQLLLMIRNLVDNAIAHSRPKGEVTVRVTCSDTEATLTVEDRGEGIPTADLERIFERFYRVDKGRASRPESTGIGLSIVKHVVQNHYGNITVASRLGSGSTFTVSLPTFPRSKNS